MTRKTDGDNRWAAILSTDLAGFTELSQTLGPERVYELLTHVLGLARRAIEEHDGHVIDTAGDGILAAFGAPNALENASLQSCKAAAAFQALLAAERESLRQRFDVQAQFRTGIGGGNTMVARQPDGQIKVVGEPVNKAARLQTLAAPGETLISETIRREAEGFIETTDRGEVEIKGFAQPIQIHQLHRMAETATKFDGRKRRGITALISREGELARLREVLAQGGSHHMALLRGPAGIGKSRLTHELCETNARPAYTGQCQPSGNTQAYAPFIDIFRQASGAAWGADRAQILGPLLNKNPDLDRADAGLGTHDPSRDQADQALRLRALYLELLRRIHAATPALFVIEDVHWIDPASEALLSGLVSSNLPILATARPEYQGNWLNHQQVATIDLDPLGQTAIRRIAEDSLQGQLSSDLSALIIKKAEGVPLMAEEITRALKQDGHLDVTPDGISLASDPGVLLTGNLEQLVLARVDRLERQDKETLEYASAIGRDFSQAMLDAALGRPAGLDQIAQNPGLIEPLEAGHWRFAHALIRDAVYGGLLSATRKDVHSAIAGASTFGPDQAGILAQHHLLSNDPAKAAPHLVRAAGQSLAAYALQEVDQQLTKALELIDADATVMDDAVYADMVIYWLRAMDAAGDFGKGLTISARLIPRLEAKGYSSELSIARMLTTIALAHTWQYDEARALAETTLQEANQQNDRSGAAWAKVALLRILDETKGADIATLERMVDEIQPVATQTQDRQMAMTAYYLLSSGYRSVGRCRDALDCADRIEAFAINDNDQRARAYAMWARALIDLVKGHYHDAYQTVRDARGHAVPKSGDERVCIGIEYYSASLLFPPDQYRDQIAALTDEAHALRDLNVSVSMELVGAAADMRAGELAKGWGKLDRLLESTLPSGNLNLAHQVLIWRVEVLLSIAGLTDPDAEAGRPKAPRKRPGLRDLVLFVKLRLKAHRLARDNINASLTLSPISPSPHFARCKIGLGLLSAAQKKPDVARALLNEGLAIAEEEGLASLAQRARTALATL